LREMPVHSLQSLEDQCLGNYRLHLQRLKQLRFSGWRGFALALRDHKGTLFEPPVVEGIFSAGGKDGIKPWMDITVAEVLEGSAGKRLDLRQTGLMSGLFQSLAQLIPPGGHLMVSYEGEHALHRETDLGLAAGIPPVLTPLGLLLFLSGFRLVKNWYLAEGGHEGPRKLWGEKPPDKSWSVHWDQTTARGLLDYLADHRVTEALAKDAHRILSSLEIADADLRRAVENFSPLTNRT
jgi:hypothetical protein